MLHFFSVPSRGIPAIFSILIRIEMTFILISFNNLRVAYNTCDLKDITQLFCLTIYEAMVRCIGYKLVLWCAYV